MRTSKIYCSVNAVRTLAETIKTNFSRTLEIKGWPQSEQVLFKKKKAEILVRTVSFVAV